MRTLETKSRRQARKRRILLPAPFTVKLLCHKKLLYAGPLFPALSKKLSPSTKGFTPCFQEGLYGGKESNLPAAIAADTSRRYPANHRNGKNATPASRQPRSSLTPQTARQTVSSGFCPEIV